MTFKFLKSKNILRHNSRFFKEDSVAWIGEFVDDDNDDDDDEKKKKFVMMTK